MLQDRIINLKTIDIQETLFIVIINARTVTFNERNVSIYMSDCGVSIFLTTLTVSLSNGLYWLVLSILLTQ